jgi:hypothetical protein
MKRIDKAFENFPDGICDDDDKFISKENYINEYCPYNLQVSEEDYDWSKGTVGDSSDIKGCRGITCIECWNKEL